MAPRPIDELLRDARRGDAEPLAELCGLFYPKVLKYMRYRVDATAAEDLAGEVFVRVLGHLSEQEGSFTAWLYRIAANVVIDHTRSKRARRESALNEDTVRTAGAAEASDRHLDLEAAIAELTDDQRELVTLKFIQGLTNGEIAEITGRSPEAIRTLQFRALMALRQILDRRAEGAGHEPQDR